MKALLGHSSRLVATCVLLLAITASASPAESAPTGKRLPLKGFNQLLVDRERGRVYVTGARRANSSVVVLDFRGRVTKVIRGLPDATGMALAEDGSLLYVALEIQRAIAVVDTKRLRRTRVYRLPAAAGCPDSVAWAGRRIWFGFFCGPSPSVEGMASLDPATGRVRLFLERGYPKQHVRFATTPRRPNLLIAVDVHQEATVFTYRLVGGSPRLVKWSTQKSMLDIAITKDATRFVKTSPYPAGLATFGVNDHRPSVVYKGTSGDGQFPMQPNAISISPTGRSLAATTDDPHGPDIHLFRVGGPDALWRYDFGQNGPCPRGAAFGASPKQLFVVTCGVPHGENVTFHVLRIPGQ
jgi:hypothetical protein